MEPITTGMQGAAVEDVQSRLLQLGYTIDDAEVVDKRFGTTTEQAVSTFRLDSGLAAGHAVDIPCWSALVDASYKLGDRTLYLRMPNFHGADVQALQRALNVLGFACGEDDGYFGPHTEAALQQFQENVGLFADGMAFQDTYAYINRLHHVWLCPRGQRTRAFPDCRHWRGPYCAQRSIAYVEYRHGDDRQQRYDALRLRGPDRR